MMVATVFVLLLLVFWMVLSGTISEAEVICGAAATGSGVWLARYAHEQGLHVFRMRRAWLRGLPALPASVLRDFGIVFRVMHRAAGSRRGF